MKYLSLCSGIEAASVGFPAEWEAVAFSEIDPFACAVLKHRFPDVPNWGDMTKYESWPDTAIELICGGTPCQSFSIAGLRKGLDDERGNLMLTFGHILAKYRPRWFVWENVPGVLSSGEGRDFASFLGLVTGQSVEPPEDGWRNSGFLSGIESAYGIALCLTLNTREAPSIRGLSLKDEGVCSLSDILETGDVPQRYYLTPKACQGILRRAEKRGKELPALLKAALESVATQTQATETEED